MSGIAVNRSRSQRKLTCAALDGVTRESIARRGFMNGVIVYAKQPNIHTFDTIACLETYAEAKAMLEAYLTDVYPDQWKQINPNQYGLIATDGKETYMSEVVGEMWIDYTPLEKAQLNRDAAEKSRARAIAEVKRIDAWIAEIDSQIAHLKIVS